MKEGCLFHPHGWLLLPWKSWRNVLYAPAISRRQMGNTTEVWWSAACGEHTLKQPLHWIQTSRVWMPPHKPQRCYPHPHTKERREYIQVTLIPSVQQKGAWIVSKQGKKHGKVWTCNYSSPGQQNHHYFRKIRNDRGVPAQPPSVPRGTKSIVTTAVSCLLNYPHRTSSVRTSWRDESYRPNTNV